MARRSSSRKISSSLWQGLFRQRRPVRPNRVKRSRPPIRRFSRPVVKAPPIPWYVYGARISIVLLGAGAIIGTFMAWTQVNKPIVNKPLTNKPLVKQNVQSTPTVNLAIGQPNSFLQQRLQALTAKYPAMELHLLVTDLTTGAYVDLRGSQEVSAASTIKIPIAMAVFQQVDRGEIKLDEKLVLKKWMLAAGSGTMAKQPIGSKFTVREALQAAITISDNTASNMLIERLGGPDKINLLLRSWGLVATTVRSVLPDFAGTNQVNARELAALLQQLDKGSLLSAASRQEALEVFRQTKRNHMLPKGVADSTAKVAHKTGELNTLLADAGLIELANGKKYIVVALVKRPDNNEQAAELIRQVAAIVVASKKSP
jgi:beta-lactamase class A